MRRDRRQSVACTVDEVAEDIRDVCRQLHAQGVLAACDGNVSMRLNSERILITPKGRRKQDLGPLDLAVVDLDGNVISGDPSSELAMHLAVYLSCPTAMAVVHAHPPAAVAWTIAHPELTELPSDSLSELTIAVGRVPIVPYRTPGSAALAEALVPCAQQSKVCILSRHGCICWGTSLAEAFMGVERLEHAAKTLCYAQMLGGITSLSQKDVEELHRIRAKIGDRIL